MPPVNDLRYQKWILRKVSRTFALTIPQLPAGLREVVGNAYLLCRLADTIEDDPGLNSAVKGEFMDQFIAVIRSEISADDFASRLQAHMSAAMSAAERDLVSRIGTVLRITSGFSAIQREAVVRCVTVMGRGMPEFQRQKSLDGLATLEDLDRYCYFVAGVVGEMLTELFCDHCPEVADQREHMMKLAVRFGQGLQMTNILKDLWEDRDVDSCWLPRAVFPHVPGGLADVLRRRDGRSLTEGIDTLVAVAHGHLRAALEYAQLLPKRETGIRRFCVWSIGLALLTLRKIHQRPGYSSAQQVKISRGAVKGAILACNLALASNQLLGLLFAVAARGLPKVDAGNAEPPPDAQLASDGST